MPLAFEANNRLEIAAYSQVESAVWIGGRADFGNSCLTTNSMLVGCPGCKSPGRAPLKILSAQFAGRAPKRDESRGQDRTRRRVGASIERTTMKIYTRCSKNDRDASDVALSNMFGPNTLASFSVWTDDVVAGESTPLPKRIRALAVSTAGLSPLNRCTLQSGRKTSVAGGENLGAQLKCRNFSRRHPNSATYNTRGIFPFP
jgi:hypothetical protein